ncbi:MAG TPA: hypothetical protein VFX98_17415 [Longimicrobiaceae bacterium]|nr:hypothetical protein [Longimicrobiaceae bacterium]
MAYVLAQLGIPQAVQLIIAGVITLMALWMLVWFATNAAVRARYPGLFAKDGDRHVARRRGELRHGVKVRVVLEPLRR